MKKMHLKKAVLMSLLAMSICGAVYADESSQNEVLNFDLDTMVVTANRNPETITQAKTDISVVTRKEIEEMHMQNVEDALRTVPGVQFLNYGANGINANISGIRINGSRDVVVLVDGVRISAFEGTDGYGSGGYMYASLLNNMDNVERVEVLRGAAGVVYGSGAKGGVVNIITRKMNETKTVLDVSYGSFDKKNYKLNTIGRQDKVGYNVYYNKNKTGDIKDGAGKKWKGDSDSEAYGLKVSYDINKDQTITASYDRAETDYSGQDYIYISKYAGKYKTNNFTLRHDYDINNHWNNSLVYRKTDAYSLYGKNGDPTMVVPAISDYDYSFISEQATFQDSKNKLVLGLEYTKGNDNLLKSAGFDSEGNRIFKKRSMKNYSYYLQEDWKVLPKLTLTGGVRYDDPSIEGEVKAKSHVSNSYKASYDFSEKDIVYVSSSEFYIMPNMDQLYLATYGNPELKPVEGRTDSIGYNKKFDDNNIVTLNVFKTKSKNYIGWTGTKYDNFDFGEDRGFNLQYMAQVGDKWSFNIGWAHLKHDVQGDTFNYGYYPKDMLTYGAYYNYAKVSAGLTGFYFMRKVNEDYIKPGAGRGWPSDNFAIVNLGVNYRPTKNIELYTRVDNLFDKLWAEHTDVVHNPAQGPGRWYAMPGRSIIVGMQYKF